jgi:hypothetical protein
MVAHPVRRNHLLPVYRETGVGSSHPVWGAC